ncbi:hypothetical protein EJ02DRAFT_262882 [Clathrospora elynae]|uniref:Uncharacterized protein n=1 Tax=Clathrospora elynae TaxID=706981 RepID=A0A6A5T0T4_9PLEO|nr:hypothetical protein EJ02DRAFT_262882 [Clathrospora elynae]
MTGKALGAPGPRGHTLVQCVVTFAFFSQPYASRYHRIVSHGPPRLNHAGARHATDQFTCVETTRRSRERLRYRAACGEFADLHCRCLAVRHSRTTHARVRFEGPFSKGMAARAKKGGRITTARHKIAGTQHYGLGTKRHTISSDHYIPTCIIIWAPSSLDRTTHTARANRGLHQISTDTHTWLAANRRLHTDCMRGAET